MATPAFLGRGLITPFRRNRTRDFESAQGAALVRSAVRQIMGTRGASFDGSKQGELLWDTSFGSLLWSIRHIANDEVLRELARTHVQDALTRFEPRISLRDVSVTRDLIGNKVIIHVFYTLITTHSPDNVVVLEQDVRVPIPLAA